MDFDIDKIINAVFAVMLAAQAIVNLTKTPKDNDVVAKVYRIVEMLAGLWTKKAKE